MRVMASSVCFIKIRVIGREEIKVGDGVRERVKSRVVRGVRQQSELSAQVELCLRAVSAKYVYIMGSVKPTLGLHSIPTWLKMEFENFRKDDAGTMSFRLRGLNRTSAISSQSSSQRLTFET